MHDLCLRDLSLTFEGVPWLMCLLHYVLRAVFILQTLAV